MSDLSPIAIKPCRHGRMMYLRRDRYVGRSLDLYGEFSELEAQRFARLLRPGQAVAELGANIGAHTVHLAKLVGPTGSVLALEPQRTMFYILCANLAMNEQFQVAAYRVAAGASAGRIRVPLLDHRLEENFGGVSLGHASVGEDVSVMSLDGFALPALHLLKIDVEGMEYEALQGSRRTIAAHRPLLYVENDRRAKSARLISLLQELGYELYWDLPELFNPDNFAGVRENVFPGILSINLLGVPREIDLPVRGSRRISGPDDWWNTPG